nr:putative polyprotein [Tanacetum cinerariifolium]
MKPSDYDLVKKIKEQVQNLPDLKIPLENSYIILETDGCMEGRGGIVKWKKNKGDPKSSERICTYASGKFSTTQSTNDAEINACINTLEKLNIYYLDKQEQQKKQLRPCETYKQSYNAKPKYTLDNQPKTTIGQIKENMFEFKTRNPEESLSNWKPWHMDWDATTSNFLEDDASNDDNKYRYNRKGFLEDDDARSDDSIFIVDPGWDDYCLQELKLNRLVPLFPEARRARM